jgi:hypothetical protein
MPLRLIIQPALPACHKNPDPGDICGLIMQATISKNISKNNAG